MQSYLSILREVRNNGTLKSNRTGVDTYSISGAMFKHDMRDGFPLLTTKKMPPKSIFAELEMFIRGITDKSWLSSRGSKIWNEWCNPRKVAYATDDETKLKMANETDLGLIYGYQWSSFHGTRTSVIEVSPRIVDKESDTYVCSRQAEDTYRPTVYGIGYVGDVDAVTKFNDTYGVKLLKRMRRVWANMIGRCYNMTCDSYPLYGGNGVFVEKRWHDFSLFLRDVVTLNGWCDVLRSPSNFDIDKDYYGSNCYSRNTCVWLSHGDIALYAKCDGCIRVYDQSDRLIGEYLNSAEAEYFLQLGRGVIANAVKKNRKTKCGYRVETIVDGKLYRHPVPVNQLADAVNKLSENPTDRRMIVMAWNPSQLDQMALPPCHFGFHLLSDGEYLDLCWFQRSVDTFLGLPFNIASYGMLLTLIAKQSGLKARYLIGHLDDVHIYKNHMDVVDEQLSRTPSTLPEIEITNVGDDWSIFDWHYTDFELKGYVCQGKLSAPVAV